MTDVDTSGQADAEPRPKKRDAVGFVPTGPVFISYRSSDGALFARQLARALRASGVPVWHDETDMPPGDTRRSIKDALATGLSAGILVVTPDITKSEVIRGLELPTLLELSKHPDFPMVIAHREVVKKEGETVTRLDHDAPDRLLQRIPPDLKAIKQYPLGTMAHAFDVARPIALHRMSLHRATGDTRVTLDLQTRLAPRAASVDSPLVVRTTPPEAGHRVPPAHVWDDLSAFVAFLPALLSEAGADEILIRGGAHLTVAYALGAALPETSPWRLFVEDPQRQVSWEASARGDDAIPVAEDRRPYGVLGKPITVFLDLVPGMPPNRAYETEVLRLRDDLSGVLALANQGDLIPHGSLVTTVDQVARQIRDFAAVMGTSDVHLYLRAPWVAALLLGRRLNTFRVYLYELDQAEDGPPFYVPSIVVMSGQGGSPVRPHPLLAQSGGNHG